MSLIDYALPPFAKKKKKRPKLSECSPEEKEEVNAASGEPRVMVKITPASILAF